jgi:hypothetical protein
MPEFKVAAVRIVPAGEHATTVDGRDYTLYERPS